MNDPVETITYTTEQLQQMIADLQSDLKVWNHLENQYGSKDLLVNEIENYEWLLGQ